ncbi:MAG: hypothetical protein IID35_07690 [Planctomycetes bacterium]|nr:hypothetical protein [Planctomycetota bacterium]
MTADPTPPAPDESRAPQKSRPSQESRPPQESCSSPSPLTKGGLQGGRLHPEITFDLFCQECAYNLRGLTGDRCPECGNSLEGVRSFVPKIPWVRRSEIGWFRAYMKTVWYVMFNQRRFCEEMARPVDFADSQKFRWVTVALAWVPLFAVLVVALALGLSSALELSFLRDPTEKGWSVVILLTSALLFLVAATGVPSYFFHPRGVDTELQNRAIALSYYSSGVLSFIGVPLLALVVGVNLGIATDWGTFFILVGFLVPCGQFVAWWLDLNHLIRRLLPQQPARAVWVVLGVPALWCFLAGLILVGLPALVLYIVVIFASVA